MKKLFALQGRRNIGKSQTIRTVDELLRAKYPDARVEHEHVLSINGVKIGVESNDDNSRKLQASFDRFVSLGCDVIICATRTTGQTVNAVNALPGYEVVWLEQRAQSAPFEQVLSNLAMARHIAEETGKFIDSAKPAVLTHAAGR